MKCLFYITVIIVTYPALHADIPATQTYGLYNAVVDGYKHLSPFYGFVAAERDVFRNYYDYTEQKDPIHQLIRALLYINQEGKLVPSARQSNISYWLDAISIGTIFKIIESNSNHATALIQITPEDLKDQLFQLLKSIKMQSGIRDNEKKLFAQIVVDSLKAAGHWGQEGQAYPQFFMHDIFLFLMYKKVKNKDEYKKYFNIFAELNNKMGILKPGSDAIWAQEYENSADPATFANTIIAARNTVPHGQLWTYLIEHYEALAYAYIGLSNYPRTYPPYIRYDIVSFFWKENKNYLYSYNDCMETAIRNLVSFIAWDERNAQFKPDSIPYFTKFNAKNIASVEARNEWARELSDIPLVVYNQRLKVVTEKDKQVFKTENAAGYNKGIPWTRPQEFDGWYYFEVKATLPNLVTIINKLFNLSLKNFGDFLTHFKLECSSYRGTEQEQTQSICAITNKNTKNCTLNIKPGHGNIESYPKELIQPGDAPALIRDRLLSKNDHLLPLMNIYGIDYQTTLVQYKENIINSPYLRHMILLQTLRGKDAQLALIKNIDIFNEASLYKNTWFYWFMNKIVSELLSLHSPDITKDLFSLWNKFGASWGIMSKKEFLELFKITYNVGGDTGWVLPFGMYYQYANEAERKEILSFALELFKQGNKNLQNVWLGAMKESPLQKESKADIIAQFLLIQLDQMNAQLDTTLNKTSDPKAYEPFAQDISYIISNIPNIPNIPMFREKIESMFAKLIPKLNAENIAILLQGIINLHQLDLSWRKNIVRTYFSKVDQEYKELLLTDIKELDSTSGKEFDTWGQDFIEQLAKIQ